VLERDSDEVRDLLLHRHRLVEVIEMTRVVPELLDVGRDPLSEPVVFLEVDGKIRVRPRGADLRERCDVPRVVDGDADHVGAGGLEQLHLPDRRRHVLRARRGHRLHRDRVIPPDLHVADADLPRLSAGHGVTKRMHFQKIPP
jgi:hypothetical protein